ncbi:hypothetical protein Tco_1296710 [Tanacetum coccineum]
MDEFIAEKIPAAVQESVFAQVIIEVKNHAPILVPDAVADFIRPCHHKVVSHVYRTEQISLTTTPTLSTTNITIPELKKKLYEMMPNNSERRNQQCSLHCSMKICAPRQTSCSKRFLHKKKKFEGQSSSWNDEIMFESSEHVEQPSSAGKTRKHPDWLDRPPVEYIDYLWVRKMDAEDRFNKVVDTHLDPEELEDGEIEPDNSTITFAKRLKRCLNVDKLNLRNLEEYRKDGYELFGNRFMSKAEYDYNMDQMTIAIANKDLKGRKYVLSITKRHAAEYKIGWIEEDIGRLFRNTIVEYDMDDMLGIHHWLKMKKLSCRGKRVVVTNGKVYSDLKITFVDEVKVFPLVRL